jgi:spermidine/putrescine-binding protein
MRRSLLKAGLMILSLSLPMSRVAMAANITKPVLTVLAPTGMLDHAAVAEFEKIKNCYVKVEFFSNRSEVELKVKTNPRYWDVVIADEARLSRLVLGKSIRPFPEGRVKSEQPRKGTLEGFTKVNEGGRMFVALMADPLGIVWRSQTRAAKTAPDWNWLVNADLNPLWRSRIALPPDPRFQFLIALKAKKVAVGDLDVSTGKAGIAWLLEARKQAKADGSRLEWEFLSGRGVAAVAWMSDYMRMRRLVSGIEFAPPASGTFFERQGVALVADSLHEELSTDFIEFLAQRKEALAQFAGLIPLSTRTVLGSSVDGWTLFEDYVAFPSIIEAELTKAVAPSVRN